MSKDNLINLLKSLEQRRMKREEIAKDVLRMNKEYTRGVLDTLESLTLIETKQEGNIKWQKLTLEGKERLLLLSMDKGERIKSAKSQLLKFIKEKALFPGPIELSSGKMSNYYVDYKLVSLDPVGAKLTAEVLFNLLEKEKIDAVGGLMIGADPICGAFAAISYLRGKPIPTFIVRKERKDHGQKKVIEGPLEKGSKVAIIDDVVTTGTSILDAIKRVKQQGCEVVKTIAIVDRQEGGKEALAREGFELIPIFTRDDLGVE